MSIERHSATILVLTGYDEEGTHVSSALPSVTKALHFTELSIETFSKNLHVLAKSLCGALHEVPNQPGHFDIDELTFSLGIDTSGKLFLVGQLSAGVKSTITIKLKRNEPKSDS